MEGFGDSDPTRTSQSRLHRGHPNPADVWRFRSDPSPTSQIMIELVIQGLLCLTVCMSIQMLRYILINKYINIYIYAIVYTLMQSHGKSTMVYQYMYMYTCLGTVIIIYIYIHTQYYSIYNYINLSGYLHVIDKPPCLPRWFSGPAPRLVEFDRLCRDQRHGPRCKGRLHHGGDESHAMNG